GPRRSAAWRRPRCRCPTPSRSSWRRCPTPTTCSRRSTRRSRPSTSAGRRPPMPEVTMPRLSDTMQEGTLARWLKQPGEKVEKGEPLAEIETDKATMELESYDSGVLEKILVPEGQTVPIGQPIAVVGTGQAAAGGDAGTRERG